MNIPNTYSPTLDLFKSNTILFQGYSKNNHKTLVYIHIITDLDCNTKYKILIHAKCNLAICFKIKLLISAMGGALSLKLPFALIHSNTDPDLVELPPPIQEPERQFNKNIEDITERSSEPENKLEAIKEQEKKSKITDIDLIEHYEASCST